MRINYFIIGILFYFIFIVYVPVLNAQSIVFQRVNEIWIADENGDNLQFVCEGRDPDISPDGKYIAFTASNDIGYVNIKSKEIHIFKSITADRSSGPKWSPNSNYIAFMQLSMPNWDIGIVDIEEKIYHILTKDTNIEDIWAPTWDPDGKYILCHGNGNILKLDLNGKIISKIKINNIVLSYDSVGFSSGFRFILSTDGNYLLFDAYVDNEHLKGLPEPPIAIFIHDLLKGETTRVTPAGICALRPCWMSSDKIIFEGFTEDDIKVHQGSFESDSIDINRGIYSIDIDGNNLKKLIENGSQPSFSYSFMDQPEK